MSLMSACSLPFRRTLVGGLETLWIPWTMIRWLSLLLGGEERITVDSRRPFAPLLSRNAETPSSHSLSDLPKLEWNAFDAPLLHPSSKEAHDKLQILASLGYIGPLAQPGSVTVESSSRLIHRGEGKGRDYSSHVNSQASLVKSEVSSFNRSRTSVPLSPRDSSMIGVDIYSIRVHLHRTSYSDPTQNWKYDS